MKLVSGGVGVAAVSITPTAITFFTNGAFLQAHSRTPGASRLGLEKIVRVAQGWDIYLKKDGGASPAWAYMDAGQAKWRRTWTQDCPRPASLPIGGRTPILGLRMTDDNASLVVTIPETLRPSSRVGLVYRRAKQPEVAPAQAGSPEPAHTAPLDRLGDLVRAINERKVALGDALVLEVLPDGRLRALVEYN